MDHLGLTRKYPIHRPLTEMERILQLKQRVRLDVEPHYQLSVIKMNSSFMEVVDKWYGWKGLLSGVALIVFLMVLTFYVGMLNITITREPSSDAANSDLSIMVMVTLMIVPVAAIALWMFCKESFSYTHYPIRFDRKNRKVHVFRNNGSVASINWNEVFFTLGQLAHGHWEIRGHVLAPDKVTVIETFALSYSGAIDPIRINSKSKQQASNDYVHAHWEFIRRYMEDGPEELSRQVQFCMPIDLKRESVRLSFERIFANLAGSPVLLYTTLFPFCLLISIFRLLAIHTSKIPVWTAEVEAGCLVEPDDPYAIEGRVDGERIAVYPDAAQAAGVRFSHLTGVER